MLVHVHVCVLGERETGKERERERERGSARVCGGELVSEWVCMRACTRVCVLVYIRNMNMRVCDDLPHAERASLDIYRSNTSYTDRLARWTCSCICLMCISHVLVSRYVWFWNLKHTHTHTHMMGTQYMRSAPSFPFPCSSDSTRCFGTTPEAHARMPGEYMHE